MSLPQILILSLIEIVGDFGLKSFANKGGLISLATGIGGYIGVISMLIVCLQNSTLMMVNGAWDGISGILSPIAAYIFLGERFQHTSQYLGIIMISAGLYFLKVPLTKGSGFVIPQITSL